MNQTLVVVEQYQSLADSHHIAQELGIEHESFFKMIKQYQKEIEEDFGLLRFEIGAVKTPGSRGTKRVKYALLTEDQTYAYLTYAQNTSQARTCKRKYVKAFSIAREMIRTLEFAPQADLEGLTARQVRMIGIAAQMVDSAEAGQPIAHLINWFIAEVKAMTSQDDVWDKYIQGSSVKLLR